MGVCLAAPGRLPPAQARCRYFFENGVFPRPYVSDETAIDSKGNAFGANRRFTLESTPKSALRRVYNGNVRVERISTSTNENKRPSRYCTAKVKTHETVESVIRYGRDGKAEKTRV